MKKEILSIYDLDKKICSFIMDIQKLDKSLTTESSNLQKKLVKDEDHEFLEQHINSLIKYGTNIILSLFEFKRELNDYQAIKFQKDFYFLNKRLGKTQQEIDKIDEMEAIERGELIK